MMDGLNFNLNMGGAERQERLPEELETRASCRDPRSRT